MQERHRLEREAEKLKRIALKTDLDYQVNEYQNFERLNYTDTDIVMNKNLIKRMNFTPKVTTKKHRNMSTESDSPN